MIKCKVCEFFLVLELIKKYSKVEILIIYFNNFYFGNGVWGVEDVSRKYFGISVVNLIVDEVVIFVGMFKGLEVYNFYYFVENVIN